MIKKIYFFFACACAALASNYRIMPITPEGLALAGSNIALSYGAEAAISNPANMAFIGSRPQISSFATLYHVGGAKFRNELPNSLADVNAGRPHSYANASDARGIDYNFGMGGLGAVLPLNEQHFIGLGIYTDMAAVFGWDTPYAKMLASNFDIRSGTAALSYAFKPLDDLSLAASLTVNHANLRYSLIKDQAKNPRYFGNKRKCLNEGSCKVADVIEYFYFRKQEQIVADHFLDPKFASTELVPHFVYEGGFKGDNGWPVGYKLAASYSPSALDNRLNLSVVYNSKYNSDFSGDISMQMARWAVYDFIINAFYEYPDQIGQFPLPPGADFENDLLIPIFGSKVALDEFDRPIKFNPDNPYDPRYLLLPDFKKFTDESPANRGKISGPARASFDYPASVSLGASYRLGVHDFMFGYSHTFWSKVNNLQIKLGFEPKLNPLDDRTYLDVVLAYMLSAGTKINWHDTDFFSLGYRYNGELWSFMGGFATEDTPLPRKEMTFMSKDARMYQYSGGVEFHGLKNLSLSFAFAHQQFADVSTGYVNDVLVKSKGKFYDQSTQIATLGLNYTF